MISHMNHSVGVTWYIQSILQKMINWNKAVLAAIAFGHHYTGVLHSGRKSKPDLW